LKTLADLAVEKQPKPVIGPNSLPVSDLWKADLLPLYPASVEVLSRRRAIGIESYGQELHTRDGRDNLADLTQEIVDALVYAGKGYLESITWDTRNLDKYDWIICHLDGIMEVLDRMNTERQS
jgi:hypothetical protein